MDKAAKTASPSVGVKTPGPPVLSLPKGGGAVRGIGEKFAANPVTGTGSLSVPISVTPGRAGFGPSLSLAYDSGSGNGPFGLGWSLSLPSITRKTDKGLPQYRDEEESDVFILSGSEDLVPVLTNSSGKWKRMAVTRTVDNVTYRIQAYRPRIEGLYARIERWTNVATGVIHWRSIAKDNVTTVYGKDNNSRIYDPVAVDDGEQPSRIFSWLISESYDDKGNAIAYEYKPEDSDDVDLSQAAEQNRTELTRATHRYLKRIKYGNRTSRLIEPDLSQTDWLFEVVFDYGEHAADVPTHNDTGTWLCRHDPFSVYRAGFEVRRYRLCQRVLMFHHFPDEEDIGNDCLVRSTDFVYQNDPGKGHPVASFIGSITQSGYKRIDSGFLKRSLPALEFEYSQPVIQEEVQELDEASLENLPSGLDDSLYQWVDLDGEGLSGILTEQANSWFYKRNLSPVNTQSDNGAERVTAGFAPAELVGARPSTASLKSGRQQFLDLAGNGQLDLVQFAGPLPGFYERKDQDWSQFTPFESIPDIDWDNPHLKFIDLTGDGHADIMIDEDRIFTWYPSLAEDGFGAAQHVAKSLDEDKGPRFVFGDKTQSIYLADMSGDGLTDLVRVRNGEICYWPNLGYGCFGAKVSMDNAPLLDQPELFDQRHIRLADIDGSGVTDLVYFGSDGVRIYFNQSGNSWTVARQLSRFPAVTELVSVNAIDLLGNGTACLVWSSSLPGAARRPMCYVDLMGGQKPHLLVKMKNNLGAEIVMQYAPSTRFYLQDKQNGKPWITRQSFPVHCVERLETYDRVSGNRFVSRYQYHHGYFDGAEREFRGFGMVEQWDTQEIGNIADTEVSSTATNLDAASFVPPIHTKTWFHTGVYLGRDQVSNYFAGLLSAQDTGEYYREPNWKDADARQRLLSDTVLPDGLTLEEEREACRALKGTMLRQEVYGLDGTDKAQHPYKVTEYNFSVERFQPRGPNQHAVFCAHSRETLIYEYERNPHDPRVSHDIALETDKYGNVTKAVGISYGRNASPLNEQSDRDRQTQTLITYTEKTVTKPIDDAAQPDDYRAPLPSEGRIFELTGYTPSNGVRFQISDFVTPDPADAEGRKQLHVFDDSLDYEEATTPGERERRLVEHIRAIYRKNDLTGFLPFGELESLAIPGQNYQLAFTPGLLAEKYRRNPDTPQEENLIPDPVQVLGGTGSDQGGYVDLDSDGRWWIPSDRSFFTPAADSTDPSVTSQSELTEAQQHFFSPRKFTDAFDQDRLVDYDTYDLLAIKTEDSLQNIFTAVNDYRVLLPRQVTDPNGNRSEGKFDALGLVVGTAVMGKTNGPLQGDSFDNFNTDLTPQQIAEYFDAADPRSLAIAHLGTATTRIIYDLDRLPICAASIAREKHVSDLEQNEESKVVLTFVYADGLGREAQTKRQAEPGPLDPNDPNAPMLDPRWVSTGATIYNNKGKPVRKYEPFFSATPDFGIEQHGVSSTLFYDPAERVVATLFPNHSWEKAVFDPWQHATYEVSATVQNADGSTDPKLDQDVNGFFSRLPETDYLPTWYEQRIALAQNNPERMAADKTAVHRQTPTVIHLDTLGRTFLTVAHNRFERNGSITEETYNNRIELDIEGNTRVVRDTVEHNNDPLGRIVMRYDYDMLSHHVHESSMEAGEHWMLNDVTGKPIRTWNSRRLDRRFTYDELRRPTQLFVIETGVERTAERTVYGEDQGATNNHRTRVFQIFDAAGVVTNEIYDFKGNLRGRKRDLLPDYKVEVNWSQNPAPDDATFQTTTTFDALNRPATVTAPDETIFRSHYNEANLLNKVEINLRGAVESALFVTNIDYNAKGQRTAIHYANGATTTYEYDPQTFHLIHLKTTRAAAPNGLASQIFNNTATVQDLHFTYDPAGNITRIEDNALFTIFHNNQQVVPISDYTYDAVHRLIEAQGREHVGQSIFDFAPPAGNYRDFPFAGLGANVNDLQALRNYVERYEYDPVGNFQKLIHEAGPNGTWTRLYAYNESSLLESSKQSNRLSNTSIGQTNENYSYDAHGNMTAMPHLTLMQWDFKDELQATSRQVVNNGTPETTFYVYDASGQRVRKVNERQNGTRKSERIYLGGFEIYREYDGNGLTVVLERETLHVMDDQQRIALVETRTIENGNLIDAPVSVQRYELANHLGSASLELDHNGGLISYEEYHPYGTTAYEAMSSAAEVSLKRFRYSGKERDEETGFAYHGARYYASWLGRWTTVDPSGLVDGPNLFAYARANPVVLVDPNGRQAAAIMRNLHPRSPADVQAEMRARLIRSAPPPPQEQQAQPSAPSETKSAKPDAPKSISKEELDKLKLQKDQAEFIVKYHQIAKEELQKRGLPESNATLLVAHAGVETSFGKQGKKVQNPNVQGNNFLSLQPPPTLLAELKKRKIEIRTEKRENVNKEGKLVSQDTPSPYFADMRQSIQIQIDLAYGHALPAGMPRAVFPGAGQQLASPSATPQSYGLAAGRGGYVGIVGKQGEKETDAQYQKRKEDHDARVKDYAKQMGEQHQIVLKVLSLAQK